MFEKQEVMHNEGGYVPNRIFGLRFVARELNMRYDTYQNYLLVINLAWPEIWDIQRKGLLAQKL